MKRIIICIYLISFLYSYPLYSQEIDSIKYQTEEIMITGTRTEQKIIDIPYSVVRIGLRDFAFTRNVGVNDVLSSVPGLFMQSRYGNHDVRISIRGFGSRSNTGIRGVRILMDEIPESEPDGQTRIEAIDFNSLGSIEIVKGNASSLYTNAPGGVINFKSDNKFPFSFVSLHNDFGEFQLRQNGLKTGVLTNDFRFLMTYSYRNYKGYREHSEEYQNILNMVAQSYLSNNSSLSVNLNYVNGLIKLPGSLKKAEFDMNPWMANPQDISRDSKRISRKGRLAVKYYTNLGKTNMVEVIGYGTIKDFDRTARTYRIFSRYGIGGSFRFINKNSIWKFNNEFSIGGDVYYQTGPISEYRNINGKKDDTMLGQTDETISNAGVYFQERFSIINNKLDALITGRYEKVYFESKNLQLQVRNSNRSFDKFTPKFAINYKFTPHIAAYTSFGLGFDTPAANEMDNYPYSSDNGQGELNPDLKPQSSNNFEIGCKGNIFVRKSPLLSGLYWDATFYYLRIKDEIIPFVVDQNVYYRNAGTTNRTGIEVGFKADLIKNLTFKTAYTFSSFKYDEYIARTNSGDTLIVDKSYSGNTVPSVPKHNITLDLSYAYPITKNISVFAKCSYMYIDGMYVNDENSEKTDHYTLLNGLAGIDAVFGNFNFLLSGGLNNILDKTYVAYININDTGGRYYEAGEPRNFFAGFNIGYRFNK